MPFPPLQPPIKIANNTDRTTFIVFISESFLLANISPVEYDDFKDLFAPHNLYKILPRI